MRKFLSLVLALTVVFTLFVSMSVSADSYTFSFGEPSYNENTATIAILVDSATFKGEYLDSALFSFITENCKIDSATTEWSDDIDFTSGAVYTFNSSDTKWGIEKSALSGASNVLFSIKVSKTADNAKISFSTDTYVEDSTNSSSKIKANSTNAATIELWKSTTVEPATAEIDAATVTKGTTAVGNDGTEYTDVPTYIGKVAISNIGSKKVVLTPVATLNGVAHTLKSAPTITFDDKTALEEGKVEFKFALIGAPTTGVELTAKVDIVD